MRSWRFSCKNDRMTALETYLPLARFAAFAAGWAIAMLTALVFMRASE